MTTEYSVKLQVLNKKTIFVPIIYGLLISFGAFTTYFTGILNLVSSDNSHDKEEQFGWTGPRNLVESSQLVPEVEIKDDKFCVIHVGPHKTASTALQRYLLRDHIDFLAKDNYKSPSFDGSTANTAEKNHANLAFCMRNKCPTEAPKRDMMNYFQSFVDNAAVQNSNILLSSEVFDHPKLNITEFTSVIDPQQYKIHIVVYYRRFYDWIHSMYNQVTKGSGGKKSSIHATFVEWAAADNFRKFQSKYSVAVYDRFKDFPGIFNISVVNMHEDPDNFNTVKRFVCEHMDRAPHVCELAKSTPVRHSNPSTSLDWKLFRNSINVYHSIELSDSDEEMWEKIEAKFYEMTDIPQRCLSPQLEDALLQISLDAEIALTPESWHNSKEGLENLKSDFEEKINSKLCSIDIEKILTSSEWQDFLTELEEDEVEQGL